MLGAGEFASTIAFVLPNQPLSHQISRLS